MTKTYQKALNPKGGWKYADDASMLAGAAQSIASLMGMRGERVYEWLLKWCPGQRQAFKLASKVTKRDSPDFEAFIMAVVMDRSFKL